jgi:transposase-like protein
VTTAAAAAAAAAASSSVAASSSSSSSSSPPKKKKWRCDVCHVQLFDDYNTAIKHERTCKSWLKSGVAAMPLTAGEKEILDDLATKAGMITTKPARPRLYYILPIRT